MGIFIVFSKLKKIVQTLKFPSTKYSTILDYTSHSLVTNLWNCDFMAPIENTLTNGAQVLDVGTGEGAWVISCAERFPMSTFIGVDASLYFPLVPKVKFMNAHFLKTDILEGLALEDNTFDFVHLRCITLIFTDEEWSNKVIKELIRVCKPGGWIEIVELDCQYINQGPVHLNLCSQSKRFFLENNVHSIAGEDIAFYLKQTGAVSEINEELRVVPFHGSKLGKSFADHQIKFMQAYKDILPGILGMDEKQWEDTLKTIRKELSVYKTESIMRRIYCKVNPKQPVI
ncbi:unnamed protein product [Rhizophagus irregularis]|uniref:S-adenosyl-L-methionine-dependent methyltransferase n=1 Tax=Rhizophagus irregularis TaxID=588596 RepID=A0A2I1GZ64_9GLOM|nr:S-adenosyl-L-methionine-dependent methyltransferase [Rhizophagus irregularis]CAB4439176.1 unnamed protein product [Rhizophagus irregularis]CAB4439260.1 unnamed protein product [Rhizophagus irregularis]